MIATDMSERRMSFYTRLPLSASTIFLGKLTANALLVTLGSAAIGLAAAVAWPRWCVALLPAVVLLLALSHYVSVVVRAGGARFLVDLTLLAAAVLAAVISTLPVYRLWGRPAGPAVPVLPRERARIKAREFLTRYPKEAYMSGVESWRELPRGDIEFTMRRLPSAD